MKISFSQPQLSSFVLLCSFLAFIATPQASLDSLSSSQYPPQSQRFPQLQSQSQPQSRLSQLSWEKKVQKIEKAIKKFSIPKKYLSAYIQGIKNPSLPPFKLNAHQERTPASLTKLFTAATALHFYPPNHRFITYLSSKGQWDRKSQTLHGDIFLVGKGDPSFTSELMWNLVNQFYRLSIRKITGNIIVDNTYFSESIQKKTKIESEKRAGQPDRDRAYNALSSALSFNWNTVNIFIRPNERVYQKAYVHLDPVNRYIFPKGHIKTAPPSHRKKIRVQRVDVSPSQRSNKTDSILVHGTIPKNHPEVVFYKNITQPSLWAGYNLKEFLDQRGILVHGKVLKGKEPKQSIPLSTVKGKTITQIVTDMNKFSNNFIAEMLLKNIVIEQEKNLKKAKNLKKQKHSISKTYPNTTSNLPTPNITAPIESFLYKNGINNKKIHLFDSSGLSKKNKLSAFTVYKLLSFLYHQSPLRYEFISSLPIAGVDGTLSSRFKSDHYKAYQHTQEQHQLPLIRAKTGSLTGVTGLAGYAQEYTQEAYQNETFVFVFIYNGPTGKEYKAQQLFDFISHILTLKKLN